MSQFGRNREEIKRIARAAGLKMTPARPFSDPAAASPDDEVVLGSIRVVPHRQVHPEQCWVDVRSGVMAVAPGFLKRAPLVRERLLGYRNVERAVATEAYEILCWLERAGRFPLGKAWRERL